MRRVGLLPNSSPPPGNTFVPLYRPIQNIAVHLLTLTTVSCGLGEGAESGADPLGSSREIVGARRISNQNNGMAVVSDLSSQITGTIAQKFLLHLDC